MHLTVLGRCGGYPSPGGACAGYLVDWGRARLLVDVGYGAVSRLLQHLDAHALNGLVLSHLHPDHVAEIPALQLALEYAHYPPSTWDGRIPTLAPSGAREHLARFGPGGEGQRIIRSFDLRAIEAGVDLKFCGAVLQFAPTKHVVETYAVRITHGGRTMVYTADTAACEAVAALARGADVLLAEATFPDRLGESAAAFAHLTGTTAGRLAHDAGARRLLLTHFFPGTDPGEQVQAAAAAFAGPVEAVVEHGVYEV